MRPKFEARVVSRVMQNRPKTDSVRILNNIFRVRLGKVSKKINLFVVNFEVIFDRYQVRFMYKLKSLFSYIPLFTLCISGNEHEIVYCISRVENERFHTSLQN
jgi:hypothetical protein